MGTHDELLRKREAREEGRDPYAPPPVVDDMEIALVTIRQRAEHVQSAHGAYQEAIMDERKHAAEVLERAIKYIQPALGALVGKIETRSTKVAVEHIRGAGMVTQQTSEEHFPQRGVLLVDRFNAVHLETDVSGTYGGTGLYLVEGVGLVLAKRAGEWSRRVRGVTEIRLSLEPCSSAEALKHFRIEHILEGFIGILSSQGALAVQATMIRARAEKLQAALEVVRDTLSAK